MSKPIKIEFIAEVSQWLRDVKKVDVSVEDLSDALVATSNDAKDLERKLSKAMKDSEKDVGGLERAIKDLPKATEKAADEGEKDFDRMGDDAKDAGKEAGSSFAGSLGEGLSSGDTSEVFQEVLGEMVSNIKGPLSAALAGGAAIALAVWNSFKAESEKHRAAVNEILDITDEVTGAIDGVELLRQGITELGGGDYGQGLADLSQYAKDIGISTEDLADIISGKINPGIQDTVDLMKEELNKINQKEIGTHRLTKEERDRRDALQQVLGTQRLQVAAVEDAQAAQETWSAVIDGTTGKYVSLKGVQDDILAGLKVIPSKIPINIVYTETNKPNFAGGAFATSSGTTAKLVYAPKKGESS